MLELLLAGTVSAQMPTLALEHLTTKEGLPSNDIWCTKKDKQGFLWVGTGRNICRYDGYTFQRLETLKVGYCSSIALDSNGTVYASIATEGLCAIDAGRLTAQTLLHNNYEDKDPTNDMHERVFVDSYNQVWMSDYTSVKRYDLRQKKLRNYALSSADNVHQDATFFEDSRHRLWIISEIGLYQYDRRTDQLSCIIGREAQLAKNKRPIRLEKAFEDAQGIIWIGGYDQGLIRFSPDDRSFSVQSAGFENQNVICGQESVDENGRKLLFIGTEKGVSLYYPAQGKVYHVPEFYNRGIHVKDMYDDKENGILWIGTREGLFKYRYRNSGIHTVDVPASAVRLPVELTSPLQKPDGNYLLGLSHSGVLDWHQSTNQFKLRSYPTNAYTYRLRWIQNRPVAFTDKGVFFGDAAQGNFVAVPAVARLFTSVEFRDGLLDRKGRFWIANLTEGLKVIDPTSYAEVKLWTSAMGRQLCQNNYIKSITEGADGKIWVATCPNGLYYFDERPSRPAQSRFVNINELPINTGKPLGGLCINAVQGAEDGSILVASWGGVNKVSASGAILATFEYKHDKLADTYCSNICEDKLGNLWFSTNEGIHIANPKTRKLKYLTTIEGLHSNYPVGFLKTQSGELLIGHINTLNILNLDTLSVRKSAPKVVITSVEVKGNYYVGNPTQGITVNPDENALTFSFSSLNFEPASQNRYQYQLEGYDDSWVDLGTKNTVSFTNLPAKTYRLQVKTSNSFGEWSAAPLAVPLTIKPHFTGTWWFRSLVGLVVAGILVGIMRWRVYTLAERNRLELQMTELKLKALQSQMNPHFLFNSLNSVQNYLLTNQGIEGAKYLSKFSKLVRRIMENSNHQYLPFEQIIDTLRMYVEIESFRFNHEFSYEFDIADDDALLNTLLPPMLLQPYVENAIWHGLMPKEGEKRLIISARVDQQHIICTIEDNGVGRAFSPRREGHISRGQEMTNGIFESLRHKDSTARLAVIDLVDADNNPAGTQIVMTIPLETP
ncbi:hypothetical protein GCM10027341_16910 [Spirosoma knui]